MVKLGRIAGLIADVLVSQSGCDGVLPYKNGSIRRQRCHPALH